jgi:hypothetical protein
VKSGSTVQGTFAYDALGRRVTATVGTTTTHLYYSTAGQVLEVRIGSATEATVQYVWRFRLRPLRVRFARLRSARPAVGALKDKNIDVRIHAASVLRKLGPHAKRCTSVPS